MVIGLGFKAHLAKIPMCLVDNYLNSNYVISVLMCYAPSKLPVKLTNDLESPSLVHEEVESVKEYSVLSCIAILCL